MKLWLGAIGRLKEAYFVAAEDEYRKRLRPMCSLTMHEAKDEKAMIAAVPEGAHLYLFDERGDPLSSMELAALLATEASHGGGAPVAFGIGGADGHSDLARAKARKLIAFGRMTIAHRLVRLIVLEQIYRAFKINRGEPYHRD